MTDFIFVHVGMRYSLYTLPNEHGKRNFIAGFNSCKTGDKVLQLGENLTLSAELNGLNITIPLKSSNPNPGFTLTSNKTLLKNVPCSVFNVQRSAFRVPCSTFNVPCSGFRVACSGFSDNRFLV